MNIKDILPKETAKQITLGNYLREVKYANSVFSDNADMMIMADGLWAFKNIGKGKLLMSVAPKPHKIGGQMMSSFKRGAKTLVFTFKDSVSFALKCDIIEALYDFQQSGGFTKGKFSTIPIITPKDLESLSLTVKSKYWE